MAVDTAAKRFSAINISQPWRGVAALPDGLIDRGDRQAVAFLYRGILAGGAVVVETPPVREVYWPLSDVRGGKKRRELDRKLIEDLLRQAQEAREHLERDQAALEKAEEQNKPTARAEQRVDASVNRLMRLETRLAEYSELLPPDYTALRRRIEEEEEAVVMLLLMF